MNTVMILTAKNITMPIIGLQETQAIAIIRIESTLPITAAKIAAAIATIPPTKRKPTRGIHLSTSIMGQKSKKKPRQVKKILRGRVQQAAFRVFISLRLKYSSEVMCASNTESMTSSKLFLHIQSMQLQRQQHIKLLLQSTSGSVDSKQGTMSLSGFHLRKVYFPSPSCTNQEIIVVSPQVSNVKVIRNCPI